MDPLKAIVTADRLPPLDHPGLRRRARRASDLRGLFMDDEDLERLIRQGDPVVYETYEPPVPESVGHLAFGLTVIFAGQVGSEYFMTRGHFHARRQTAEVYYGLRGRGYLLMQDGQDGTRAERLEPGSMVYVPPGWAHRSVNAGTEPLVFMYVFPAHAGHDYGAIRQTGFSQVVVQAQGRPVVVDRGAWINSADR